MADQPLFTMADVERRFDVMNEKLSFLLKENDALKSQLASAVSIATNVGPSTGGMSVNEDVMTRLDASSVLPQRQDSTTVDTTLRMTASRSPIMTTR